MISYVGYDMPHTKDLSGLLKSVDSLAITFLVDNCIEWFTKLPPGFSHELRTHLANDDLPVDEVTGVPVLNFDNFCCGAHGFSALIQTQVDGEDAHLSLFDAGPDSQSLVRNIAAMQVPVEKIERVVLSHWHSDHSGGLLSFLRLRRLTVADESAASPCVIDLHPDRPIARGIAPGPRYDKIICALPSDPTFEAIEKAGGVVEMNSQGHAVADGTLWVSGEIPRLTPWEGGILGGSRWKADGDSSSGKWIKEEHIMDERYAAIDVVGKGLVVFSACSHAGIVNVIKDAITTFGRPIYMVIGGLHLATPDLTPRIVPTIEFLAHQLKPSPTYVLPMHCSGFQAKVALEAALGEGCVPAGVGLKVQISGDRSMGDRLFSPTY